MAKWFDTLRQQKEIERNLTAAVESVDEIPEDASPDHGWSLVLRIRKITPRLTAHGQTYYWLSVRDKAGYAFSIVVWSHQWDDLGPFEEGEVRQLTVKVPTGEYTAWSLF
jgi:DNA polymerase III alpha subunit